IYTDNITRQRKLVKYILVGLEQQTPYPAAVDYEQMTIEHLASQSLIGEGEFNDPLVGQIGNLLLVSDELNGKLKDKSFKDKKKILLDSGFKLPEQLEAASTWGPAQIRQRTQTLAERAYNDAWKL
ncbi:MAG: HNH endonuclease family protein, partial [Burkholderiales bacterium]